MNCGIIQLGRRWRYPAVNTVGEELCHGISSQKMILHPFTKQILDTLKRLKWWHISLCTVIIVIILIIFGQFQFLNMLFHWKHVCITQSSIWMGPFILIDSCRLKNCIQTQIPNLILNTHRIIIRRKVQLHLLRRSTAIRTNAKSTTVIILNTTQIRSIRRWIPQHYIPLLENSCQLHIHRVQDWLIGAKTAQRNISITGKDQAIIKPLMRVNKALK